ncbi:hypothetical protein R6Q59_027294 [Mikania micrantha]
MYTIRLCVVVRDPGVMPLGHAMVAPHPITQGREGSVMGKMDPDVDVVSETQPNAQPASSRRRHRRKEVHEKTTKPSITRWSESEEVTLARAHIDVSEDPIVVFSAMGRGSYRTNDMISGKWRDLQCKVAKFNGIWVQHHNNRKSGVDAYARENGPFAHIASWQVMRKSTKWHPVPKLQTSKRTKTLSSGKYTTTQSDSTGRCFVNLNELDEEVEMDMPPSTSPQRPLGRNNKGKRPQASSSTDYKDTLETISDSLQKFVSI